MDVHNRQRSIAAVEYGEVVFYTHACGLDRGRHGPSKESEHGKQQKSINIYEKKNSEGFTTLLFWCLNPKNPFCQPTKTCVTKQT